MTISRATGWETMRTSRGNILQAGVQSRPIVAHHDPQNTMGWITRAVVLQIYYPEEDDRKTWTEESQKAVTCDVRTYGRYQRLLFKVPVLQNAHGLFDTDFRIPRRAQQDIDGGELSTGAASVTNKAPTAADAMDADHVLIGFLDNDPNQPVIMPFTLGHPRSKYVPTKADGRVKRFRHNGVLMLWDNAGNFTIDATEAAKDELAEGGIEDPNNGVGGIVTFKTKDGDGDESQIQLGADGGIVIESAGGTVKVELIKDDKVHLNSPLTELSDAAPYSVVKGELFVTALSGILTTIAAGLTPPTTATAVQTAVTAFANAASDWLSTKVKTG